MPTGSPRLLLGHHEDVIPEPGLLVALQLGQVEVGAGAPVEQGLGVVEEVEPEVEQRAGDRLAIDRDVLFVQMPAAGTDQKGGRVLVQAVLLALGALILDDTADGVADVELPLDGGVPGRRVSILEIGHEHLRARVERVDDHLAIDGPGDLDAAVQQIRRNRRDFPVALADVLVSSRKSGSQPASSRACTSRAGPAALCGGRQKHGAAWL